MHPIKVSSYSALVTAIFCVLILLVLGGQPVKAAGVITGVVYQDYNTNGHRDLDSTIDNDGAGTVGIAVDHGIGGVTVTAYNAVGGIVGTAVTQADGTYTMNVTGAGPYRVEFSDFPAGYEPSAAGDNNATTVQFVPDPNGGTLPDIDLGINLPSDYCQNNPQMATTCYVYGDQFTAPAPYDIVLIDFPYSAGSDRIVGGGPLTDFLAPGTHNMMITAPNIGTTYGLAYHRPAHTLYAAAFTKRHSGYGPGGTGAIYVVDTTQVDTSALFVDLNALFPGDNPGGTDFRGGGWNYNTDGGDAGWDAVGKIGLGDLAINDAQTHLYVMALGNRTLYELPLDPAQPPTAANSRSVPVPLNPPGCPSPDDVRPFALRFYQNSLWVGITCTAESTVDAANIPGNRMLAPGDPLSGNPAQLFAYVYRVDPVTLTFDPAPAFQMPLNYTRTFIDPGFPAAWQPWSPIFVRFQTAGNNAIYPQPWLVSIAFDHGNLILGFRDRNGDQVGQLTQSNPTNPAYLARGIAGGDVLRACGSIANGWTLEANGQCGGIGNAPPGTGEGPGMGEYYFADSYRPDGNPHAEVAMGGVAHIPGFPDIVATMMDPAYIPMGGFFDRGGLRWFNNTKPAAPAVRGPGGFVKAYQIYDTPGGMPRPLFGKANGLGPAVAFCNLSPLEVGNRVWLDSNRNGFQDPGETPFDGVTVNLYEDADADGLPDTATPIATTQTAGGGQYYFIERGNNNGAPGTIGLPNAYNNGKWRYGINYVIQLDFAADYAPGGVLYSAALNAPYFVTTPDIGGDAADMRDSDGIPVIGPTFTYPRVSFNIGQPGEYNHTYDFGFTELRIPTPTPTPTSTSVLTQTPTPTSTPGFGETPTPPISTPPRLPPGVTELPATGEGTGWFTPALIVMLMLTLLAALRAAFIIRRE